MHSDSFHSICENLLLVLCCYYYYLIYFELPFKYTNTQLSVVLQTHTKQNLEDYGLNTLLSREQCLAVQMLMMVILLRAQLRLAMTYLTINI